MHVRPRNLASRALALLMALVLCLSLLPVMAGAQEQTTYTQVTSAEQIKQGGSFVLAAQTDEGLMALGTEIDNKIGGVQIAWDGASLSGTEIPLWTAEASGEGVSLYNGNAYLGYSSGTNFSDEDQGYAWNVTDNGNGTFRFTASGASNRGVAWQENNNGDPTNRFGAYAVSNAGSEAYIFDLVVFQAETGSGSGDVTVAAPQAQPQGGEVAGGTEITLTCATAGASIYYTLDGSQPTTGSELYS